MTARLSPQRETETPAELREALIGFCLVALPNEPGFEKAERLADRFEAAVRAEMAAELAAVRTERDEARAAGGRWWKRAREAEAMVYELKRPSIEKERNEVRSSMTRLTSEAEAEGDHEGVATLARELDKYEAKWRRQDDEMQARIGADSEEASS